MSRILVVSPGWTTASWLAERLDRARYSVLAARPGPGLIEAVRRVQPHVAVLDAIDARPHAAQLELALLKDQCPGVQVIALSAQSTDADGDVIEQGVFCYLAGGSLEQLLRVIAAAVQVPELSTDTVRPFHTEDVT
jgi:CheY-like chemotaxis protein